MLSLPPHTSHHMQALDVTYFQNLGLQKKMHLILWQRYQTNHVKLWHLLTKECLDFDQQVYFQSTLAFLATKTFYLLKYYKHYRLYCNCTHACIYKLFGYTK